MFKTAQIVVVGSEFFSRDKRDTNSIWLTEELEKRGVRVLSKTVAADELATLQQTIIQAMQSVDLVLTTGGLGPTEDDRTREASALALGVELEFHQYIVDELKARYAKRGRTMAENNRRQAYVPEGGAVLPNETGTAPGFCCTGDGSSLVVLPGPPREMKAMFAHFLDQYEASFPKDQMVTAVRTLRVTGLGESDMDRKIADLYKDVSNPEVTINFTPNDLEIHLTSKAQDLKSAEEAMKPMIEAIKERLEGYLFSDDDQSLAEVVVNLLKSKKLTLSIAESVTGGHVAHMICSVPGAS